MSTPIVRAVTASSSRRVSGIGPVCADAARCHWLCPAVNNVRPVSTRSRVDVLRSGSQAWGMSSGEVDLQFAQCGATAAGRVDGSVEVVFDERSTFGLVGVEQRLRRPAVEDPGELPREVEAAGDRGVHAGATSRGDAMGGVTGKEHAVVAPAVGELSRKGERRDSLDADVEVGLARRRADQLGEALVCVVGERLACRDPIRFRTATDRHLRRAERCRPVRW